MERARSEPCQPHEVGHPGVSSPSWGCARSRVSRAGIATANYSSGFSRIDLHVRRDGAMNVITRRLPPKEDR